MLFGIVLGLSGAVCGCSGLSGVVWELSGAVLVLFVVVWGCLGLFWCCLGCLVLSGAVWGCLGLSGAVWGCSGVVWCCSGRSGASPTPCAFFAALLWGPLPPSRSRSGDLVLRICVTVCNFALKLSCGSGSGDPESPESKRERSFRVIFATVARKSTDGLAHLRNCLQVCVRIGAHARDLAI